MLNGKREVAWFRLLHAILLIIFVVSLVLCGSREGTGNLDARNGLGRIPVVGARKGSPVRLT